MKILHVLSQLPQKTGSGVYFLNLLKQFTKKKIENVVLYAIETPFNINFEGINNYRLEFKTDRIKFAIPGMSDKMPYESTIYSEMSEEDIEILRKQYREKLSEIREKENPDVILSHHLFFLTDLVREIFFDKKVIGICHGTDLRQINKHPRFMKHLKNIKDLDRFLTVSQNEISEIEKLFSVNSSKITRVGGGYDPEIFNYDKSGNKFCQGPIIFYAGKISDSKGVFELASSLKAVSEVYPDAKMYIVGNSSEKDRKRLNENAGYSKNLKLYDAEDQKMMSNHLKLSDIYVLPSYYEALGLSAIEALACGKLVVANDIEGLKTQLGEKINNSEIIEYVQNPRIINLDEAVEEDKEAYVKRLAKTINLQISRLDKYKEIPDELMKEVQKNSWINISEKIYQIIEEMITF